MITNGGFYKTYQVKDLQDKDFALMIKVSIDNNFIKEQINIINRIQEVLKKQVSKSYENKNDMFPKIVRTGIYDLETG